MFSSLLDGQQKPHATGQVVFVVPCGRKQIVRSTPDLDSRRWRGASWNLPHLLRRWNPSVQQM